jgi:flagellar hook-basal body complex protein FliE
MRARSRFAATASDGMSQLDPLRGLYGSQPIQPIAPDGNKLGEVAKTADGKSFDDVLTDFVKQVDQAQTKADDAIDALVTGKTDNLHAVMISLNEAQITLKLAAEVRNKLVDAYKEVMRTQF